MCGRFALSIPPAQFRLHFGCAPPEGYRPRWNVTPDSDIVIVRAPAPGAREAAFVRWGLLAPWMDDPKDPGRMINARIETAASRPMFRDAFARRRCLVPADGFYEWRKQPRGPSRPFFVRLASGEPMGMAGIWRRSRLADGGQVETAAILTRDAPPDLRPIHHRVPVVIRPEHFDLWLDPTLRDPAALAEALAPLPGEAFDWYEVSRRVNDPRNDDPGLVEPADRPPLPPGDLFGGESGEEMP